MNDTLGNPYPRQVILAMSLSAGIVLAARGLVYVNEANGHRLGNPLPTLGGVESFLAWGVMLVMLVALADVETTGALGASFAWLIFLAIIFTYGIPAAENLRVLMSSTPITTASQIEASKHPTRGESIRGPR